MAESHEGWEVLLPKRNTEEVRLRQRGGFPVRLGAVMPTALERLGPRTLWTEAKLRRAWTEAVGADLAAHAQVRRLRGKTLEVQVASDAWATELRYLAAVICERLNARLGPGTVTQILTRCKRMSDGGA
jgi:predicted nucleic acid-binding Zn ribbon protein